MTTLTSHAFWKMITGLADIMKVKVLVAQFCPILCGAITVGPFPSPEDLPHPGIETGSSALQADSLPLEPPRNPLLT